MATEWKQKGKEEEAQELRSEQNESPSSDKSRELVSRQHFYKTHRLDSLAVTILQPVTRTKSFLK